MRSPATPPPQEPRPFVEGEYGPEDSDHAKRCRALDERDRLAGQRDVGKRSEPDRGRQPGKAQVPAVAGAPPPLRTRTTPTPVALRLEEVARALGVSVRTVQRLIAAGDLPASRLGRIVVVEAHALSALLARTRIGGGS